MKWSSELNWQSNEMKLRAKLIEPWNEAPSFWGQQNFCTKVICMRPVGLNRDLNLSLLYTYSCTPIQFQTEVSIYCAHGTSAVDCLSAAKFPPSVIFHMCAKYQDKKRWAYNTSPYRKKEIPCEQVQSRSSLHVKIGNPRFWGPWKLKQFQFEGLVRDRPHKCHSPCSQRRSHPRRWWVEPIAASSWHLCPATTHNYPPLLQTYRFPSSVCLSVSLCVFLLSLYSLPMGPTCLRIFCLCLLYGDSMIQINGSAATASAVHQILQGPL